MEAPQLLQNLPLPAGLPHCGQTVVRVSILPCQTVAVSAASSMLRCMARLRACAANAFANQGSSVEQNCTAWLVTLLQWMS